MKKCVCLVCLRTFDKKQDDPEASQRLPLLTKFLKFAENYLQVSTVATKHLFKNNSSREGGENIFCEECETEVVNPICQRYLDLLSLQLRLAEDLCHLGKLLQTSEQSTSEKLRMMNMKALTNQLGMENVSDVEEFRRLLAQKCKWVVVVAKLLFFFHICYTNCVYL